MKRIIERAGNAAAMAIGFGAVAGMMVEFTGRMLALRFKARK